MIITIGIIAGIITGIGVIITAWVAVTKFLGRMDAIAEGVLGKPEVKDFSGQVIEPAIPSIQARVSNLEALMKSSNTEDRLTHLEIWREEHMRQSEDLINKVITHMMETQS